MTLPFDKNDEQFTCSRIFCRTKIRFISYHQLFCGKLERGVNRCFVEQLFSKLVKISKTQVVGYRFSKFLQSAVVETDVLLGIIFYNRQTNNYMTSPVSTPLNILRICEESKVAFYCYTDLTLVVTYTICRDALRTKSNIYDGAFLRQQLTAKRP